MLQIKVTTNFPKEPILRQTPGQNGLWKDCRFAVNDFSQNECDFWAVMDGTLEPEKVLCRSGRTIFFAMEPPGAKKYSKAFLKQFDLVVASDTKLRHPHLRFQFQGLPWHIGLDRGARGAHGEDGFRCAIDYDQFVRMEPPQKTGTLSVICSNNASLPGHRLRLKFIDILKKELGDEVELFGRGIRPVGDKFEAIAPFQYHIALENTLAPHYWSEKIGDAFLGFAYPIYWGCPNLDEYFDPRSFTRIDIAKPEEAIDTIKQVIRKNTYEQALEQVKASRQLICDQYNMFEVIRQACISMEPSKPRVIRLNPQWYLDMWNPINLPGRLYRRLQRMMPKAA